MKSPELQHSLEETETKTGEKTQAEKAETPQERLTKVDKRIGEIKDRLNMTAENALKTEQGLGKVRHELEIPTPDEKPVSLEQAAESSEKLNAELKNLEEEKTGLEASLKSGDSGVESVEHDTDKNIEVGDKVYMDHHFYTVLNTKVSVGQSEGSGEVIVDKKDGTKEVLDPNYIEVVQADGFGAGDPQKIDKRRVIKVTEANEKKIEGARKNANKSFKKGIDNFYGPGMSSGMRGPYDL